ncbi:hypothetical protein BC939DRAFT_294593 [Gamsiella multidivaricata]|uniref:uncharacterized protein n=1 Tax=Gamsiella multidivaricata TaxID=101098 RepID=UPI0022200229|nr:uncharacterized protein BC939DRAFT_294593 [Gamsiella multidivaricata]KAI7818419.1 hypothetical protein BC939DRAFT_294593 [Gamsiella multidivaricata]
MEWTYHDVVGAVVSKSSTHQLHKQPMGIAVAIKMHQQIYVPGDPLSMATTLVNNGQNKIVGLDVILRRTIKGTFATSYANLCNQAQVEIMSKAVDCKVRPGESNQVDILTTIPPMEAYSIPTFESNFLKVYYELLCVIRVKRSVFAGGDTSYQCVIPIPIATHNIDNPMITGRTPRWTKSRMQPYFFEPTWADPVGDLHAPVTNDNDTINNTSSVTSPGDTPTGIQSPASASTASLLGSPGASSSAMHEFLNSGSAELHRERTLKKSLTRSKSLKDIQSARLNGSSWRAERDQLLSQSREAGSVESSGTSKRSPPLGPKSRSSNEDKQAPSGPSPAMDSNGNVAYTPPPPSTSRSQRNASNNLTPEQQAELARKASRRILPNQGMYTNEGTLPPDYTVNKTQSQATGSYANGHNNNTEGESGQHQVSNGSSSNNASFPVPSSNANSNANSSTNPINKIPPRRNASLSQKAHQQLQQLQQQSSAGSYGNGNLVAEPDSIESHSRGGSSMGYSTNAHNDSNHLSRGRSNNGSSDQGQHRSGQEQPYSSAALERIPYQHSLPAHQQPPGVVSPTLTASPPYASMAASGTNCQLERSPSRRDGVVAGDILPPPPPFNKAASSGTLTEEGGRHHRRTGSNASANGTASASLTKIPPWERVERIHHQDWFRPGPHQSGALQTFDVAGLTLSQQQAVPILKKSLQRPMETVQSIEVEEHLR